MRKISAAGVVGAGGAGFPTHVSWKCQAEHFIVNGIECEPLLRTDRHTMERHAPEIVETVQTIQKHLGAAKVTIALKRHYHEAAQGYFRRRCRDGRGGLSLIVLSGGRRAEPGLLHYG